MKVSKVLFNISAVICFIFGAVYIFTLVFIPVGIYCFIAAKRFSFKADHMLDSFSVDKNSLKGYVIFASIACFPFGLISIIPYLLSSSNNISVENVSEQIDLKDPEVSAAADAELDRYLAPEQEVEEVEVETELTEEEKNEKFEKLKNFHKKGIITDDELEMAREQLFGKEEK